MPDTKSDDKEVEKPIVAKSAVDLQRLKLMKLMKNPEKPILLPERPKEKNTPTVPEFVRNVMGSSAGAGSGEFHVYRHLRRKEYSRQKFIQEKSHKELMDEEYHKKLEENKQKAAEVTAKKRAKRLKKKQRKRQTKKLKSTPTDTNTDEDNKSDSEEEEEDEDDVTQSKNESDEHAETMKTDLNTSTKDVQTKPLATINNTNGQDTPVECDTTEETQSSESKLNSPTEGDASLLQSNKQESGEINADKVSPETILEPIKAESNKESEDDANAVDKT